MCVFCSVTCSGNVTLLHEGTSLMQSPHEPSVFQLLINFSHVHAENSKRKLFEVLFQLRVNVSLSFMGSQKSLCKVMKSALAKMSHPAHLGY